MSSSPDQGREAGGCECYVVEELVMSLPSGMSKSMEREGWCSPVVACPVWRVGGWYLVLGEEGLYGHALPTVHVDDVPAAWTHRQDMGRR